MTHKEVHNRLEPKLRTNEELAHWIKQYSNSYEHSLMCYFSGNKHTYSYYLNEALTNHHGITILMIEQLKRKYCE